MSPTHNGLQGTAKEHLEKNRIQQRDQTGTKRQSEQNASAKKKEQSTRVRDYENGRDSPILTQPTTGSTETTSSTYLVPRARDDTRTYAGTQRNVRGRDP